MGRGVAWREGRGGVIMPIPTTYHPPGTPGCDIRGLAVHQCCAQDLLWRRCGAMAHGSSLQRRLTTTGMWVPKHVMYARAGADGTEGGGSVNGGDACCLVLAWPGVGAS